METKHEDPECLPSGGGLLLSCKGLRVHRSLLRSLEYFQSREKLDFLRSAGPNAFKNPSGHIVGKLGLLHWPQVQVRGACSYLCRANASPSEGLLVVVWRYTHNRLIA